jgi:hypothetical protein
MEHPPTVGDLSVGAKTVLGFIGKAECEGPNPAPEFWVRSMHRIASEICLGFTVCVTLQVRLLLGLQHALISQ